MSEYRILEEGEIIREGDEVDKSASFGNDAKWVFVKETIGKPAPNPRLPAHHVYRRKVEVTS